MRKIVVTEPFQVKLEKDIIPELEEGEVLLQKKELQIFGSRNALEEDFREVIDIIKQKKVDVKKMITARYALSDAETMFESICKEKGLKRIVDFRENV